jgi:hypothetical protein
MVQMTSFMLMSIHDVFLGFQIGHTSSLRAGEAVKEVATGEGCNSTIRQDEPSPAEASVDMESESEVCILSKDFQFFNNSSRLQQGVSNSTESRKRHGQASTESDGNSVQVRSCRVISLNVYLFELIRSLERGGEGRSQRRLLKALRGRSLIR